MTLALTYPVRGGYLQYDTVPHDGPPVTGQYYRVNWIKHSYNLLGKIPSEHEADDVVKWNSNCYGDPVAAIGDGTVTYAARATGTWGNLIVIDHGGFESRYAHLSRMDVKKGDKVLRGRQIGAIGDANGVFSPHLHWGVCKTSLLLSDPTEWPSTGRSKAQADAFIDANFVDPLFFVRDNLVEELPVLTTITVRDTGDNAATIAKLKADLTAAPPDTPVTISFALMARDILWPVVEPPQVAVWNARVPLDTPVLHVRLHAGTTNSTIGNLAAGDLVTVTDEKLVVGDFQWCQIKVAVNQALVGGWVARIYLEKAP